MIGSERGRRIGGRSFSMFEDGLLLLRLRVVERSELLNDAMSSGFCRDVIFSCVGRSLSCWLFVVCWLWSSCLFKRI